MLFDVKITPVDKFSACLSLFILVFKNVIFLSLDIMTDMWTGINSLNKVTKEKVDYAFEQGLLLLILPFVPGFILTLITIKDMIRGKENLISGLKTIPFILLFPLYQLIVNIEATLNIMRENDKEKNTKRVMELKFLEATLEALPAFIIQSMNVHIYLIYGTLSTGQQILVGFSAILSLTSLMTTTMSYIETRYKWTLLILVPFIALALGALTFGLIVGLFTLHDFITEESQREETFEKLFRIVFIGSLILMPICFSFILRGLKRCLKPKDKEEQNEMIDLA